MISACVLKRVRFRILAIYPQTQDKTKKRKRVASHQIAIAQETVTRYVIVTPIQDEEKFIEATIASVRAQTVPPAEWVIVDDGSVANRTGEIIERYASQIPWIRVVHRENARLPQNQVGEW